MGAVGCMAASQLADGQRTKAANVNRQDVKDVLAQLDKLVDEFD